jgi:hypothetical protein
MNISVLYLHHSIRMNTHSNLKKGTIMKQKQKKEALKKKAVRVVKSDRAITRSSRKIARSIVMSGILLVGMQSCGGFHASFGTTAGIRANNDYATGLVNETKTPAGTKGAHYMLREKQASKRSWVEGLIYGGK